MNYRLIFTPPGQYPNRKTSTRAALLRNPLWKKEPLVGSSAFFILVLNNGDQLINHTVWYCLIATAMAEILVMMLMMTWQGNPLEAPNIAPTRSSAKKNDWSYGTLKLVFDAFCNFLCISDNAKLKKKTNKQKTLIFLESDERNNNFIWAFFIVVERHRQNE